MELLDVIKARRSVRVYNGQPVPEEALHSILEAGLLAPTGRDLPSVELIAVRDRDMLCRLTKTKTAGSAMLENANCAIVVIGNAEKSDTWVEDGSIAMTLMQLRATELGAASCWVQCRHRVSQQGTGEAALASGAYVKQLLHIPERYEVLAILSLGMSDTTPPPHTADDANFSKVHEEQF